VTDARNKAADLANKLLRTASPSSGATEAERTSAALTAAELFAKHELSVVVPEPPVKKRRRPPPPQPSPSAPAYPSVPHTYNSHYGSDWTAVKLSRETRCEACGRPLYEGETVYFEPTHGLFIHYDIGCSTY
jgi:hypothetical protein